MTLGPPAGVLVPVLGPCTVIMAAAPGLDRRGVTVTVTVSSSPSRTVTSDLNSESLPVTVTVTVTVSRIQVVLSVS